MLIVGTFSFGQETFTLEEAVQYAIQNHPNFKLQSLDVADAESDIKKFTAIGLPKVNGKVDYIHNVEILPALIDAEAFGGPPGESQRVPFGTKNNLTAQLEVSQLIFDGSFFVGLQAQRLYKELVVKQVSVTSYEIRSNVTKAYLSVLIAIKKKEQLDRNITQLEKTLFETKAIYENGFAEKLDVERLELSLDNLKVERDKILRLINASYNLLKFQMGYPLENDIAVRDEIDQLVNEFTIEALDLEKEIDFAKRPEYSLLEKRAELNELNVRRIKSSYLPSLVGFASHQQVWQQDSWFEKKNWLHGTLVGLNLNIPIFDGFERRADLQSARINMERVALETKEFERGITLSVVNARTQFVNAQKTIEARKKTIALAEKIYETTQIKYREGVGSSVELRQAENELYDAQDNYIDALYDLLVTKIDLDIALGEL